MALLMVMIVVMVMAVLMVRGVGGGCDVGNGYGCTLLVLVAAFAVDGKLTWFVAEQPAVVHLTPPTSHTVCRVLFVAPCVSLCSSYSSVAIPRSGRWHAKTLDGVEWPAL